MIPKSLSSIWSLLALIMAEVGSQLTHSRDAALELNDGLLQNIKTALEDPQYITLQNGTGGKIYRAGFLAKWELHCHVSETAELLFAANLREI